MASSATHLTLAGSQFTMDEKLGEYLRALEEERTKVEAFKRELPLCLHLIDEAIESAKQRAMEQDQCSPTTSLQTSNERSKGTTPVLENFMPLKRRWEKEPAPKESKSTVSHTSDEYEQHHELVLGRPAWSGEAHLWTQQSPDHRHEKLGSRCSKRSVEFGEAAAATDTMASSRLHLSSKHRQGGAFVPFIRERHSPEPAAAAAPPAVNAKPTSEAAYDQGDARMMVSQGQSKLQSQRKTRRCWSPELHRRFVSALQQLGGSQVATPKQIRELMKVDSLTNDEVKSHLQKYRLHTLRPSPSPSSSNASAQAGPQLVVLGWMRPDQFQAAVGASGAGVVCDGPPPLMVAHKYAPPAEQQPHPPMSMEQPSTKHHLPAVSTSHSSLPGRSSVTGGSPNSSSDSDMEEADHHDVRKVEEVPQQLQLQLQPARESKGSTTSLVDIGTNTHTSRKTAA